MESEVRSLNIVEEHIDSTDGLLQARPFERVPSLRQQWEQGGYTIETTVPIEAPAYGVQELMDLGYIGVILSHGTATAPNDDTVLPPATDTIPTQQQRSKPFSIITQIDAIEASRAADRPC